MTMSTLRSPLPISPRFLLLTVILLCPVLWLILSVHDPEGTGLLTNMSPSMGMKAITNFAGGGKGVGLGAEGIYRPVKGETRLVQGVAGATMWENIYLYNGTFHIISSDPDSLPPAGYVMRGTPAGGRQHQAAGEDRWRVISPGEAIEVLGAVAMRKEGISVFFNDSPGKDIGSFLDHYFHFAEVFLAAWRVISASYDSGELPTRLIFRTEPHDWRDHAGLTTWFQTTVLPRTIIEDGPIWNDRARSGVTFVFDSLAIVDRFAAHAEGTKDVGLWNKMTMDLIHLHVDHKWMNPLRESLIRYVVTQGCDLSRGKGLPIVTYINRQRTNRRLADDDSDALDAALEALAEQGVIELHNEFFEDIPRAAQFCLALKTDIMLGVHGNGLTHQMWMAPGSAVVEFMSPTGFAMDYAFLAKLMGHKYSAIHYDRVLGEDQWIMPDGKPMYQGDSFHVKDIPVDSTFVAGLVADLARGSDMS